MADYKDIITGTLNNLFSKAKNAVENGTVREVYDNGLNRAKVYGQMIKSTLEVNGETEELKKVYNEIGRLYYEQAKDAPEGYFVPLFARVESLTAGILEKQEAVRTMKEKMEDERLFGIEVEFGDFDDVVSEDEEENK